MEICHAHWQIKDSDTSQRQEIWFPLFRLAFFTLDVTLSFPLFSNSFLTSFPRGEFCRTWFGKCCFTVYKAPSHTFSHLILGTNRYYYPDFTGEETSPKKCGHLKAEPDSNPGLSMMLLMVWDVWRAGHQRDGKT